MCDAQSRRDELSEGIRVVGLCGCAITTTSPDGIEIIR